MSDDNLQVGGKKRSLIN